MLAVALVGPTALAAVPAQAAESYSEQRLIARADVDGDGRRDSGFQTTTWSEDGLTAGSTMTVKGSTKRTSTVRVTTTSYTEFETRLERQPVQRGGVQDPEVRPVFPQRFGSLADARAFVEQFFSYYNHQHRHSGIGLHTPASVHFGTAGQVRAQRQSTLDAAYAAHPESFGHRRASAPKPPQAG